MSVVMPTIPLSALRKNQPQIIKELESSPKLLTNNGYDVAVLVSPQRWNQLMTLVDRLEDSQIIRQRSKEMDDGLYDEGDDVKKELISRGLLDA